VKSSSGRCFANKKENENQRATLAHVKSFSEFTCEKDLGMNNKLT
jgi:hypothetical protein